MASFLLLISIIFLSFMTLIHISWRVQIFQNNVLFSLPGENCIFLFIYCVFHSFGHMLRKISDPFKCCYVIYECRVIYYSCLFWKGFFCIRFNCCDGNRFIDIIEKENKPFTNGSRKFLISQVTIFYYLLLFVILYYFLLLYGYFFKFVSLKTSFIFNFLKILQYLKSTNNLNKKNNSTNFLLKFFDTIQYF